LLLLIARIARSTDIAWCVLVLAGNVIAADAFKDSVFWGLLVLFGVHGAIAAVTRPSVDAELASPSRLERVSRLFLAGLVTLIAVTPLVYLAIIQVAPARDRAEHPVMPIGQAALALLVGLVAAIAAVIWLRRLGTRGALVTRVVFAGCAAIAAVFLLVPSL
jgi:hypothetical protein